MFCMINQSCEIFPLFMVTRVCTMWLCEVGCLRDLLWSKANSVTHFVKLCFLPPICSSQTLSRLWNADWKEDPACIYILLFRSVSVGIRMLQLCHKLCAISYFTLSCIPPQHYWIFLLECLSFLHSPLPYWCLAQRKIPSFSSCALCTCPSNQNFLADHKFFALLLHTLVLTSIRLLGTADSVSAIWPNS